MNFPKLDQVAENTFKRSEIRVNSPLKKDQTSPNNTMISQERSRTIPADLLPS